MATVGGRGPSPTAATLALYSATLLVAPVGEELEADADAARAAAGCSAPMAAGGSATASLAEPSAAAAFDSTAGAPFSTAAAAAGALPVLSSTCASVALESEGALFSLETVLAEAFCSALDVDVLSTLTIGFESIFSLTTAEEEEVTADASDADVEPPAPAACSWDDDDLASP